MAEHFAPGQVLFSLMSQYTPQPGATGNLARHVTAAEYRAAAQYMENCGITDGYTQERHLCPGGVYPGFRPLRRVKGENRGCKAFFSYYNEGAARWGGPLIFSV